MQVKATAQSPQDTGADTLACAVFDGEQPALDLSEGQIAELVASGEARSRFKHLAIARGDGRRVIVAGLGARGQLTAERARIAAALVARRAGELGTERLCWLLPHGSDVDVAEGLVHGTMLATYRFERFRSTDNGSEPRLAELVISDPRDAIAAPVDRAAVLAAAQNRARDLGNRPPNDLTPTALADYAVALTERHPQITAEILSEAELRALGMGAFAAVAQGSDEEARLIVLRYDGGGGSSRRLGMVGKAVTFDSGGLWVKPGMSMPEMKFDMAGGAAVVEAVAALAQLRAPADVLAVIGATENLINGRAMRPSDIVTALDGTTVEINNTDAEGRLVLADCIAYARREGCAALVDVATLTGSIVSALGAVHAGLMSNDDELARLIAECAGRTGELVWRMPLHPDYAEMVKGRYAQVANLTKPRGEAAAITAAEFLHHFAGDTPWAHLDIAGMGDDGRKPYFDKGATGFGVRLLTELALAF